MELLITIAYVFLIRLIFFDYKLLRFNLLWKFIVFGLYVMAALTEVVFLGQYAPYSKQMFVQSYVVQMAPEFGGLLKEVHVSPSVPVKKGDPLFTMDTAPWQYKVDALEAQLTAAGTDVAELNQDVIEAKAAVKRVQASLGVTRVQYKQFKSAAEKSAVSRLRVEQVEKQILVLEADLESAQAAQRAAEIALDSEVGDEHTAVAEVLADLNSAKYNLEHAVVRAPSDGYVANLQVYPGSFVRLKTPVMAFVNSEEHWLVATVRQRGVQRIRPGDSAEVAFEMYPGKVFDAVVENVVWATGESQFVPSGQFPQIHQIHGSELFMVRMRMKNEDASHPLRFGASGLTAIYTKDAADFLLVLRKIELQSESFLNFIYNPFS